MKIFRWSLLTGSLALLFGVLGCQGGANNRAFTTTDGYPVPGIVVPGAVTLAAGESVRFTTSTYVVGGVEWKVEEQLGGWINTLGVYMAPPTPGTYHVLCTGKAGAVPLGKATITVNPAPTSSSAIRILIIPREVSLRVGETVTFSAKVTGTLDTRATWCVLQNDAGGSVTPEGIYTAPMVAGTYNVVARSVADPQQYAVATITVTDP